MDLNLTLVIILILSGVLVGFINSISAGGTAISISLFLFFGLPPNVANATNRIGVLIQSLTSSITYKAEKVLDMRRTLILSIPAAIGAFLGSCLAMIVDGIIFEYSLAFVLLLMLFIMFYNPKRLETGNKEIIKKKIGWFQILIYFLIGIYGGFVQVGTGFFLMAAGVLVIGHDLVRSNAMKVSIMFFYTIVSLLVFFRADLIRWEYGILHSIGAVVGAIIGSKLAVKKGVVFIKWITAFVILITAGQLLGLLEFEFLFEGLLKK